MSDEVFEKTLEKCQDLLARGKRSNWGYQWSRAFEGDFQYLVNLLHKASESQAYGIEKKIKRSAEFLIQASEKIACYMPDFDRHVYPNDLLAELNDLTWWWFEDLAVMGKNLELINAEELRARSDEPESLWGDEDADEFPEPSPTIHPTCTTRKRRADEVAFDENVIPKIARPSAFSRSPRQAASVAPSGLPSASSMRSHHADGPDQASSSSTTLASEQADDLVFAALDEIRGLFFEGIKRLNELEIRVIRSRRKAVLEDGR